MIRVSNPVLRVIRSIDFDNWKILRLSVLFFLPFWEYNKVMYITSISVITTDHVPSLRVIIIYVRLIHKPRCVTSCLHTYTHAHFYDTCGSLMFNSVIISLKQPIVEKVKAHDIFCDVIYIYIYY